MGWSHGDRGIVDGSKGLSLSGSTIKLSTIHFASGLVLLLSGSNHPIKLSPTHFTKKKGLLLHKKKSIDNKTINLEKFTLY